ncbi:MAG: hypothetical protein HKN12_07075 [Gemmatimonadetes bacterium]|nr:hypothetical protein [Gemmatimonadota bacterium]
MPRFACFWAVLALVAATAAPVAARHAPPAGGPPFRIDEFSGWFHGAGNLLLHISNRGLFGTNNADETFPSAEWPAGTREDYLYAAGLWVGGVLRRGGDPDTLCTSGLFQFGEWANRNPNEGCGTPLEGICRTFEGAPSGLRRFDDDADGLVDEDPLDGRDNDGDGRTDEDFAGISQEMFRTVYYDTSTFRNDFVVNDADRHTPLGLQVIQESYQWTDPQFDDFVGIEFRVKNISEQIDPVGWDVESAYIGFMVDGDIGLKARDLPRHLDDAAKFASIDTMVPNPAGGAPIPIQLTMGYMYDEIGTAGDAADDVPGFIGAMFLGHTVDTVSADIEEALAPRAVGIHAFRVFTGNGGDPRDDLDRYRFLRGEFDTAQSIGAGSTKPEDWRFLISAGPFHRIPPGSTLTFQVAFVCGNMVDGANPETGLPERVPDFTNPIAAQRVYNGFVDTDGERVNWATSSPPPPPNLRVTPGDRHVVLEWDDFPERVADPLTKQFDFAGYQVWKAEGWRRESTIPDDTMWRLIADYDSTELSKVDSGLTGIGKYRFVDSRALNGFWYWYAVSAYDRGTFVPVVNESVFPPDTTYRRTEAPKFGKFSQNMVRVMPRTTPAQTLDDVYVVPNPYREAAHWDLAETAFEPTGRRIKFFNLPDRATIRIFTLAGDHIVTLDHDDRHAPLAGQTSWNLVSKNDQDTVSGIYLYQVSAPSGRRTTGKFVVIR